MRRKKKHKKRARPQPVHGKPQHGSGKLHIILDLCWALCFFVLLVLAKEHFVDHSVVGEHIKQATYDVSQIWLSAGRKDEPQIVVVDIGTLEPCAKVQTDGSILSPRQALKDAVTAVMKENPTALGIDADFSPGKHIRCPPVNEEELAQQKQLNEDQIQFTDRGGPPFFDFCLEQTRPIYLGVYRTQDDSPEQWLGFADYSKLAATITLPVENAGEEHQEGPADGVRKSMTRQIIHENGVALDSLSFALSKHKPKVMSWTQRFLEHLPGSVFPIIQRTEAGDGITIEKFLVDFSSLKHLEETTARYEGGKITTHGTELSNKLVLLGYTDSVESIDKFIVPGDVRQVAGVYWHASALDTLIRGMLAQPTKKGEFVLDAIFYVPIVLLIFGLRLAYAQKPGVHISAHRIESIGTKIAALLIFLCGTYLVSTTRLMWDGFLMVAIVTALHPTIEGYLRSAAQWLRQLIGRNTPGTIP